MAYTNGQLEDEFSSSSDESGDGENVGHGRRITWSLSDSDDDIVESRDAIDFEGSDRRHQGATGLEWLSSHSKLAATLASIELAVTCLYRIPVRQPATYNRLKKYRKSIDRDFE